MRTALIALSTALAAGAAFAQQPDVPAPAAVQAAPQEPTVELGGGDPRVNQLIIYGDDPCPQSSGDEIIVCARLPEDDRYRIPPGMRSDPGDPENRSWTSRAVELSYVGASGIGSCTPTGPGGSIGCFNQIVQQARAERAAAGGVDWNQMIQEAREERMRRIDEEQQRETEADQNLPD